MAVNTGVDMSIYLKILEAEQKKEQKDYEEEKYTSPLGARNLGVFNTSLAIANTVQESRDNYLLKKGYKKGYFRDKDGKIVKRDMYERSGEPGFLGIWEKDLQKVTSNPEWGDLVVDPDGNPITDPDQIKLLMKFDNPSGNVAIGTINPVTGKAYDPDGDREAEVRAMYTDDEARLETGFSQSEREMGLTGERYNKKNEIKKDVADANPEVVKIEEELKALEGDINADGIVNIQDQVLQTKLDNELKELEGVMDPKGENKVNAKVDKLITDKEKNLYGFPDENLSNADKLEWLANNKPGLVARFMEETKDANIQVDGGIKVDEHPFPIPKEEIDKIELNAKNSQELAASVIGEVEESKRAISELNTIDAEYTDKSATDEIAKIKSNTVDADGIKKSILGSQEPYLLPQEDIDEIELKKRAGDEVSELTQDLQDREFLRNKVAQRDIDNLESSAKMTANEKAKIDLDSKTPPYPAGKKPIDLNSLEDWQIDHEDGSKTHWMGKKIRKREYNKLVQQRQEQFKVDNPDWDSDDWDFDSAPKTSGSFKKLLNFFSNKFKKQPTL